MKNLSKTVALATSVCLSSTAFAHNADEKNSAVQDAWLDGKIDTVVLLNKHLNPFKIDTDVRNGVVFVTGSVDSDVHSDLMTEIALSIDGIKKVENDLQVKPPEQERDNIALMDASITTAITTKLLFNDEINSFEIDVDTSDQTVTLNGVVETEAEKALVEKIATSTKNVESLKSKLTVKS